MEIVVSILLIGLMFITTLPYTFQVLKKKEFKVLFVQLGILGLAIIGGILLIFEIRDPSISSMLNQLSPIGK
ncbi:MAG TPA: hypothetical protein VJ546_12235 [Bacillales bacterium]|nr:hypothetical protein [Bacillales bacterium]